MVLREGAELALILRAVEVSSEGLQTWIGTIAGIAGAVAVGLFFLKGHARAVAPVLRGDERHFDVGVFSVGDYRVARTERGALAAIEQDGNGRSGPMFGMSCSFLCLFLARRRC